MERRRLRLSLFVDYMLIYVEISWETSKNLITQWHMP